MNERLTRADVVWGYLAQFMNLAAGLLLLPLLAVYFTPQELGLWFVFLSMVALTQLIESGFQPNLARAAAYVHSGVTELQREGFTRMRAISSTDLAILGRLLDAGRRAYRWIALVVAALLVFAGGRYVLHLEAKNVVDVHNSLAAWLAYAAGVVLNAYFGYYNAFILGRGDVAQNNKIIVATKTAFLVTAATTVVLGQGLLGLGVASLLSAVVSRGLARQYYVSGSHPPSIEVTGVGQAQSLWHTLWPNTLKLTLVQLGAFLILRANTLIASTFVGLAEVASYGITVQLLLVLSGLSGLLANLQLPKMNALQLRGDRLRLQQAFGLAVVSSWLLFGFGAILLFTLAEPVLTLLGKNVQLVEPAMLAVLTVVFFLEMNHSVSATYLTTLNTVPFVRAALASGIGIVVFGVLLCGVLDLGLWGIVLAQGIVQLAYNNWKWPMEAVKHLQGRPAGLLRHGFHELFSVIRGH